MRKRRQEADQEVKEKYGCSFVVCAGYYFPDSGQHGSSRFPDSAEKMEKKILTAVDKGNMHQAVNL